MLGYPVYIDENVLDIAASAVSILFGNFKRGDEIPDQNIRIVRDPYTNKPYVNFYTTKRLSGMLVDSKEIRLLKMAAS